MTTVSKLTAQEQHAFDNDRLIDITTTGRKSGKPSRIETGFYRYDGTYFLSGLPGKRDWYANLLATPSFTIHLKQSASADIRATAHPVENSLVRASVINRLVTDWKQDARRDEFLKGSPLLEVTIDGQETKWVTS